MDSPHAYPLPPDEALYAALLARDAAWDGKFWVGVTSTGIICRPTCPARKPKRANVVFFADLAAGLEAGFRPCLRCRPLDPPGAVPPQLARLIRAVSADPDRRWSEADVAAFGLDPSTVRRAFRRRFGVTFLAMARALRLARAARRLGAGASVIEAQIEAGYESPSGFRAAFARATGAAPSTLANRSQGERHEPV